MGTSWTEPTEPRQSRFSISRAADASWSTSAEDAMEYRDCITGEVLEEDTAHELRSERDGLSDGWVGPSAGLGVMEDAKSGAVPIGPPLRGENAGEIASAAASVGVSSGDTEAEDRPDSSARASGDVGEGGAGGIRGEAIACRLPAVFRSSIHCSR